MRAALISDIHANLPALDAGLVIMGVATGARAPAAGRFNPARTLGPALVGGIWTAHWVYWAAPIAGMVAAMHTYELLRGRAAPATERSAHTGTEGTV
ncbi:MAG: aquaporin [Gemmatimonadaceae bacterium]